MVVRSEWKKIEKKGDFINTVVAGAAECRNGEVPAVCSRDPADPPSQRTGKAMIGFLKFMYDKAPGLSGLEPSMAWSLRNDMLPPPTTPGNRSFMLTHTRREV
jgi:hypothetical protein